MDVLKDEDERGRRGAALKVAAESRTQFLPELARGDLGEGVLGTLKAREHRQTARDGISVSRRVGERDARSGPNLRDGGVERVANLDACISANDQLDRVVGNTPAIGEAATRPDAIGAKGGEELARKPCLARSRRTNDGHEPGGPVCLNLGIRIEELPDLGLPANERRPKTCDAVVLFW